MRLIIKYVVVIAAAAAFLAGAPVLRAQQVDSTKATQQNKAADYSKKHDKNAQSLKMRNRYRPKDKEFRSDKFYSNIYVTMMGAAYRQFNPNYSNGPFASLTLGKWISPRHGIEISGGASSFKDNYEGYRLIEAQARLSYLFNISAYTGGYNPHRLVELYSKVGAGYGFYVWRPAIKASAPTAHLGLQVNIHVFPSVDLVLEPLMEFHIDARKLPVMDVWRGYILALQGGVGMKVNLDPYLGGVDPGLNWFTFAMGGVQVQNSDFEHEIGFARALGPSANVGFGRYYTPWFAIRMQAGSSTHFWKEIPEGAQDPYGRHLVTGRFRSTYFFARLEGKVDFLRLLFPRWAKYTQIGLSGIAGPEVGLMIKKDPNLYDIKYPYVGLSASVQASVRLFSGLYLNLEPRISIVPYSAQSFTWANYNKDYYDALWGVSLGIEYRFGRYYL